MACFVVAVVPDSVAVVVCRSSASGRVLVRHWQISLCCFVLDVLLIAADCWLIIYSSSFFVFFLAHFYFPASGHTSRGHRCRPSLPPPGYCLHFFLAHRVQHPLIVDFYRVLLTHALALSASQLVHITKTYTSTHSGWFKLTKLTYTRLEDITWYATGAVSDIEPVAPVV